MVVIGVVVRGLYEGSSLTSISSCNEFSLKLKVDSEELLMFCFFERQAADDLFICG
jgi:hypothetical protein